MLVKCEKDLNVEELIKDLDAKSKKKPIDEKNSYTVAVNRQLLADARDVLRHYYEQDKEKKVGDTETV